ncbi:hypothetical protein OF377_02865 [Ureaplasma sp. ES3154-GEN]|uniref:hypothetical protein n=1 Tax=Ureaplasma sp. ES3154-GEN TaxID=2984844 RepID=UPI0021E86192|nr:hypothetical protein [Ureaplasma sp. ES3154-GEN]MCV3743803.1 hypothetical protein [Ureaplasma sp. ES3154-GEN]
MKQNLDKTENKELYRYSLTRAARRRIATWVIISFLILLFLVGIALLIAFVADFYIYENSNNNGLLWTVNQRVHGFLGYFNNK